MKVFSGPGVGVALKIVVIIILLLILLIPLDIMKSILYERQVKATEVNQEIITGVGGPFHLFGPIIVRPWQKQVETIDKDGLIKKTTKQSNYYVLPDFVEIIGKLEADYRYRGIYKTPIYKMILTVNGQFTYPKTDIFPESAGSLSLVAGIPWMGGLRELSPLQWGNVNIDFNPDSGSTILGPGMVAQQLPSGSPGQSLSFSWTMELDGGGNVGFMPMGRDSTVVLSGDWPSPSFKGSLLPNDRTWGEDGFHAKWLIPELSRPLPYNGDEEQLAVIIPDWDGKAENLRNIISQWDKDSSSTHSLIVELMDPVTAYKQIDRAQKYRLLFLIIPFILFFMFEVLWNLRIHFVQYLFVGLVAVIFYLLLLALTEHFGFNAAHSLSALGTGALLCFYQAYISRNKTTWLLLPLIMAAIYFWLWVTLKSEDYALLIGQCRNIHNFIGCHDNDKKGGLLAHWR